MLDRTKYWESYGRRLDGYSIAERIEYRSMPEPNSGCVLWLAALERGYGVFSHKNKKVYAHRAAYELAHGPIPNGLHVCHKCDNPACVNPGHMFLGTLADNMDDKVNKGRQARGSRAGGAKLTARDVQQIRFDGRPHAQIAAEFDIHPTYVSALKRGDWWKHLPAGTRLACRRTKQ